MSFQGVGAETGRATTGGDGLQPQQEQPHQKLWALPMAWARMAVVFSASPAAAPPSVSAFAALLWMWKRGASAGWLLSQSVGLWLQLLIALHPLCLYSSGYWSCRAGRAGGRQSGAGATQLKHPAPRAEQHRRGRSKRRSCSWRQAEQNSTQLAAAAPGTAPPEAACAG